MESEEQKTPEGEKPLVQKFEKPVHPKTGEPIKIIGPNCEFCGINASTCEHSEAFRGTGMLKNSAAMKEENKVYQNFEGLPNVISKICEFCGVDAGECVHAADRREKAKLAPDKSLTRTEVDPATGAKIFVKEPADMEATEEHHTGEEAAAIAAQVNAQNTENEERDAQPDVSDDVAGDELNNLADDQGVGDEDVDLPE